MDVLKEELYLILLIMTGFTLIISYVYSKTHQPKSIFQKPTNHIEIRNWRIK
jgi:hypothetical protein